MPEAISRYALVLYGPAPYQVRAFGRQMYSPGISPPVPAGTGHRVPLRTDPRSLVAGLPSRSPITHTQPSRLSDSPPLGVRLPFAPSFACNSNTFSCCRRFPSPFPPFSLRFSHSHFSLPRIFFDARHLSLSPDKTNESRLSLALDNHPPHFRSLSPFAPSPPKGATSSLIHRSRPQPARLRQHSDPDPLISTSPLRLHHASCLRFSGPTLGEASNRLTSRPFLQRP